MSQTCLVHGALWGMDKYCTRCGTATVAKETVVCPSDHPVSVSDLYCGTCGVALEKPAAP